MDKISRRHLFSRAPRLSRLMGISVSLLAVLLAVGCNQQVASLRQSYVDLSAEEAFNLIQLKTPSKNEPASGFISHSVALDDGVIVKFEKDLSHIVQFNFGFCMDRSARSE